MTTKVIRTNKKPSLEESKSFTRLLRINLPQQGTKTTSISVLGRHRSRSALDTRRNYSPLLDNLDDLGTIHRKNQAAQRKVVRLRRKRKRKGVRNQDLGDENIRKPSQGHDAPEVALNERQIGLQKQKAFLERIRSQEPDIDEKCVIRKTESDDVLIRQKRTIVATKTLHKEQTEVVNIRRIENSGEKTKEGEGPGNIGRGGFGEVSAWELTTERGKVLRVAVKSFDPAQGGRKLARAEASLMVEFEQILNIKMLLYLVPQKPTSFPSDFPAPSIIMPLFESRNCVSPSLHNLVFEHYIIQPAMAWIRHTLIQILLSVSKLHAAGWAHGDLHGGNIILQSRKVILIDYSKANRKDRPYVYNLEPGIDWINKLDWIEPLAVTGQNCCSRAADIYSLGKLTEALIKLSLSYTSRLRSKERQHHIRLLAFIHLAFHRRQFRPDCNFLIEVLRTADFSSLNLCSCQDGCEMLMKM